MLPWMVFPYVLVLVVFAIGKFFSDALGLVRQVRKKRERSWWRVRRRTASLSRIILLLLFMEGAIPTRRILTSALTLSVASSSQIVLEFGYGNFHFFVGYDV